MVRLVETFDGLIVEALLQEHPGHANQNVHGHRYGSVAAATVEGGGFSANWVGHRPRSGYMVGGVVKPYRTSRDYHAEKDSRGKVTPEARAALKGEIKGFVAQHLETLRKPGHYLGTWIGDDGHAYVDVSQRVNTRSAALALGGGRGEQAIYDVRRGQSIDVPAGGG